MKQLLKWIGLGLVCCIAMSLGMACTEEADCTDANRPMMNVSFFSFVKDTLPDGYVRDSLVGVAFDTLTVTAFGTDSVIVNKQIHAAALTLPLRYAVDTTIFVLDYSFGFKDTLTLLVHNTPYFLNMDCGYQMKQVITGLSYTNTLLDSVVIKDPKIGIYGKENLAIYY